MAENKNFFKVDGVVYAKPVKSGTSKKGQPYSIPSLVIELKSHWEDREGKSHDVSDLIEFRLNKNVSALMGSYEVNDHVTVSYRLAGRKFESAKGVSYMNEPLCYGLAFADLDSEHSHAPKREVEKVFVPPAEMPDDDDLPDVLPF